MSIEYSVANNIGTITFANETGYNSVTRAVKADLVSSLRTANEDEDVRCIVLTGKGRSFCVGRDLKEHTAELQAAGGTLPPVLFEKAESPVAQMFMTDKPIIAAVNGVAAGAGAAFAFAADIRVMKSSASYRLAFSGVGLSCDNGTSWTLQQLVGRSKALELFFRARSVSATEALGLGLTSEVFEDQDFESGVSTIAAELASGPTLAFMETKKAINFAALHDPMSSLENEFAGLNLTKDSIDHSHAVSAFLNKEKPHFIGR